MFIDYKFRWVMRDDKHTIALVAFYTGDMVTVADPITNEKSEQYRRTALLQECEYTFDGDVSDDDLRVVMNIKLAGFEKAYRPPIPQQVAKTAMKIAPIAARVTRKAADLG